VPKSCRNSLSRKLSAAAHKFVGGAACCAGHKYLARVAACDAFYGVEELHHNR